MYILCEYPSISYNNTFRNTAKLARFFKSLSIILSLQFKFQQAKFIAAQNNTELGPLSVKKKKPKKTVKKKSNTSKCMEVFWRHILRLTLPFLFTDALLDTQGKMHNKLFTQTSFIQLYRNLSRNTVFPYLSAYQFCLGFPFWGNNSYVFSFIRGQFYCYLDRYSDPNSFQNQKMCFLCHPIENTGEF